MDAIHVGEIDMATAADAAILAHSRQDQRVVVTLDSDFHALLALSGASSPSVIRIRIEGLRGESLAALLRTVLGQCGDELALGPVITVQEGRMRVRRLPLRSS